MTDGRGPDSVIDAVGLEAHSSGLTKAAQKAAGLLPDVLARPFFETGGVDRLGALYTAIDMVRRGGTISLSGVYGGQADPLPMLTLFDKQIRLTMGQGNVKRWAPGDPAAADRRRPAGRRHLRQPHRLARRGAGVLPRSSRRRPTAS